MHEGQLEKTTIDIELGYCWVFPRKQSGGEEGKEAYLCWGLILDWDCATCGRWRLRVQIYRRWNLHQCAPCVICVALASQRS